MKYLLATVAGFTMTLGVFVAGVALAIAYLSASPVPVERPSVDAVVAFSTDVTRADTAKQNYERTEARPVEDPDVSEPEMEVASLGIDEISTAALPDDAQPTRHSDDHVAWCRERYRSYQPESNSYTPYSGGSRECVSPFSGGSTNEDEAGAVLEASLDEPSASESGSDQSSAGGLDPDHIESCFARYRSYRPADNTYQPYGGGPRVSCE